MMELIRQWVIGVACAAVIGAAAQAVMPEGAPKKAGRLAVGLLLLLAVVRPLVEADYEAMTADLTGYQAQAQEEVRDLTQENQTLVKAIIEEQTAAYISDKAKELGLDCTVRLTWYYGPDGEVRPEEATVRGEPTDSQQRSLSGFLEEELGIPAENQSFERVTDQ